MGRWPSHPRRPSRAYRKASSLATWERLKSVVSVSASPNDMSAYIPKLGAHNGKGSARQAAQRMYTEATKKAEKQLTDTRPTYAEAHREQVAIPRQNGGSSQLVPTWGKMPDYGLHAMSTSEISSTLGNLGLHNSEVN